MATTMSPEDLKARKRQRQKLRRAVKTRDAAITELFPKPISEWDEDELARGRPKAVDGTFRGTAPKWVTREVHEEAIRRFQDHASAELRGIVPKAIATIIDIVTDTKVDEKGRPITPRAVQLEAAKWCVEHLVGKPKVRLEADISVKLQGILAEVMVSPEEVESGGYRQAIETQGWDADDDEDLVDAEG